MRRGSLVAPVLLILVGVVFLLNNVNPELPLMDIAAQYWPFLLVLWGALRLIEIFFLYFKRAPLPVSGISGGEWALVVLISLVGSGLFVAHRVTAGWPAGHFGIRGVEVFGESYDYPLDAEQQGVGKVPRIVVENLRGNTRIVGTDTDQVKVTGRKTVRALRQEDADKSNQLTPIEVTQAGDQVVIRTNQERAGSDHRISADLEITVPKGSSIQARGRYGDFDVTDIDGSVEISSDNAGVRLQTIGGDVRTDLRRSDIVRASGVKGLVEVKSNSGEDVDIENVQGQVTVNGNFSGEIQFRNLAKPVRFESAHTDLKVERVAGELRMGLGDMTANDIVGPLTLSSRRSRDVEISGFSNELQLTLDRGDVTLRPAKSGLGKMEVKTRSGNIELALPENARFDLVAGTERGSVDNQYGSPLKQEERDRGAVIIGSVGSGPALRLNTGRGEVLVRKGSAEEVTAEAEETEVPQPPVPPKPRRPKLEVQ